MSDLRSSELAYGERIGSGGSDAILASFFRDILFNLDIPVDRFQALLDRYIISQGIATNTAEISTNRSALRRELISTTMTWKVFNKGLKFLRAEDAILKVTLYHDDARVTHHECVFRVDEQNNAPDDDSETNTLAKFFREILQDLDVDDDMFQSYLDKYVKFAKPKTMTGVSLEEMPKLIAAKRAEEYYAKCSLKREILKDSISWKVFVRGLIFLGTKKVKFDLKLFHKSGLITRHEKIVSFK